MNNTPFISVIIPCRNEEKFIEKCITSVLNFDLPNNTKIEIIVVDGMSEDRTVDIIREIMQKDSRIRLLLNPGRIQACALNIAIKVAKGNWLLRLDAHSIYPKDYLLKLLETAIRTDADNIGGVVITKPGGSNYQADIVQALTTHRFGVGNSGFRTGISEGFVDTVPFGFLKKQIFNQIGFFDERLVRAQDYEFNRRIIKKGGKIWLNPNIYSEYYNQQYFISFLKKQFFKEAPYNAYMWYLAPYTFAYRHAITGVFAVGIIGGLVLSPFFVTIRWIFISVLGIYFVLGFVSAIQQAIRYKRFFHVLTLPGSFFLYHFIHGIGVLKGILLLLLHKAPVQKIKEPWNGAGRYRIL